MTLPDEGHERQIMVELLPLATSFAIGVGCSMMPCCIGIYPGLFAYLETTEQKTSRFMAGVLSAVFASGVLVVVGLLGLGVLLLQVGLATVTHDSLTFVDIIGFAILLVIGGSYILGRSLMLPIPQFGLPAALSNVKGLRAAPLYGIFFGGPGAAHCTFMLVIPIIFLGLASTVPSALLSYFLVYAVGRIIPIIVVGVLLRDAQMRFVRVLSSQSKQVNRLIGILIIISGISLFFVR